MRNNNSLPHLLRLLPGKHSQKEVYYYSLSYASEIVLLDDLLARRTAHAAGLTVWGTLKILLEAKERGLTGTIAQLIDRLNDTGLWISDDIRHRILMLAGEHPKE